MRFLHAADIHLDSPLRGLERFQDAPTDIIRNATRQALENLVDHAVDDRNGIDFVVIAGDLFDGNWKHFGTGLFFNKQMVRLAKKGIRVAVLAGNHDAESKLTHTLPWPDNVYRFRSDRPETFEWPDLKVALHGQSYPDRAVREDMSATYPARREGWFNIGVLHTCGDGTAGHEPYAPCSVPGLTAKGYDYWALGHVHKRWEVARGQHGAPWIVFPGNTQGRDVGEQGEKGCTVVTVDNGKITAVKAVALDVVRWHIAEVDVSGLDSRLAVLDRVAGALDQRARESANRLAAVRVVLKGRSEPAANLWKDPEALKSELRAKAEQVAPGQLWIEDIRVKVAPPVDEAAIELRTDALKDVLVRIRDLKSDQPKLEQFGAGFASLQTFLPRELREGPDALDFKSPAVLAGMLDDAQQILLSKLREG